MCCLIYLIAALCIHLSDPYTHKQEEHDERTSPHDEDSDSWHSACDDEVESPCLHGDRVDEQGTDRGEMDGVAMELFYCHLFNYVSY